MKVVTGEVSGITVSGGGKRAEKAHREGAHRQHRVCVETVVLAGSTQLFRLSGKHWNRRHTGETVPVEAIRGHPASRTV